VFRSEGHAGCDFGKALIAETTGTAFTDTAVANGREYSYNVVAAGSSSADPRQQPDAERERFLPAARRGLHGEQPVLLQ